MIRGRRTFRLLLALLTLTAFASLTGCQSSRDEASVGDPYSIRDAADLPRSMVVSGKFQRRAGELPWYADRNDYPRSVASGRQSVTVERSDAYIYDRQSSYDGRAHNHYHETRITRQSTYGTR